MRIQSFFSVPLIGAEIQESAQINKDLRDLFLKREADGERWRNPMPSMEISTGLFESSFDLFTWSEPCVQALHDFCIGTLLRAVAELNSYSIDDMREMEIQNYCWFHITRRGGRFHAHNHAMASWSGVYCVSAGHDGRLENASSGALQFQNPHQLANMFLDQGNGRLPDAFNLGNRNIHLKDGQLILFPSWLFHEVLPYHGDRERITVAFNCWFRPRGAVRSRLGNQPVPLHW